MTRDDIIDAIGVAIYRAEFPEAGERIPLGLVVRYVRAAKAALAAIEAMGVRLVPVDLPEEVRQAVAESIADELGGAMDCLRVWEAWSVGTMTQDDFALVSEDADRVSGITTAAISALLQASPFRPSEEARSCADTAPHPDQRQPDTNQNPTQTEPKP